MRFFLTFGRFVICIGIIISRNDLALLFVKRLLFYIALFGNIVHGNIHIEAL